LQQKFPNIVPVNSERDFLIAELEPSVIHKHHENHIQVLLKERTKERTRMFHVCDPFDVQAIKSFYIERNRTIS
jgi:hypothetical protein